jgi:hypothetical protein
LLLNREGELLVAWASAIACRAEFTTGENMLAHNVYFTLAEKTHANRDKLIAGCKQYLSDHPGTVFFAVGGLAEELRRDVNDLGFDVALHIVFADPASQDVYQDAPRHNEFIDKHKHLWSQVRVFDSIVDR